MKEYEKGGRKFRIFYAAYLVVSEDGTTIYQKGKNNVFGKKLKVLNDYTGAFVLDKFGRKISVARAIMTCFCPPRPDDGKDYMIGYKDGNKYNCHKNNLVWMETHYRNNLDSEATFYHSKAKCFLTIRRDGSVWVKKKKLNEHDALFDSDVDLLDAIPPYVYCESSREIITIEDMMGNVGFVDGDFSTLAEPVILHRDNNYLNNSASNLEWVERTDQRYVDYLEREKIDKHNRRLELNPGKQLHPGW